MCRSETAAAVAGLALLFSTATPAGAEIIVADGWDLQRTSVPESNFMGIPFEGVPLGSYDFGGAIGVQATDTTDTLVHRLQDAVPGLDGVAGGSLFFPTPPAPDTGIIEIELVQLQLRSIDPFDFGAGLDFHYVTLQSIHGGPSSLGEMQIQFNPDGGGGTFDSVFPVFFDLRIGALNGPIIFSANLQLSLNPPMPWGRIPPPGALMIDGVNRFLAGPLDPHHDFWPGVHPDGSSAGCMPHSEQDIAIHCTIVTPEPATLALLAVGMFLGLPRRARHSRTSTRNT